MTQDWTSPDTGDLIDVYTDEFILRDEHIAKMDFTGDTNIPSGFIRANSSDNDYLERYNGSVWNRLAFITALINHIADTTIHTTIPPGTIAATARTTAPSGWLICDGTAVNRTTYASLYSAIGVTYGVGDGATTFNLPDLRQRFPLGKAVSGTGSTLGGTGGNIDHTHTGPSHTHTTPAHAHSLSGHVHSGPSHQHTVGDHQHWIGGHYHDSRASGADINIVSSGSHSHDARGKEGGSSGSGANRALGAASTNGTAVTWSNGVPSASHSHSNADFSGRVGNVSSGASGDAGFASNYGGAGSTSFAGTGNTGGPSVDATDTSGGGTTGAGGTGSTGSGNPPFQVVNWMIKT